MRDIRDGYGHVYTVPVKKITPKQAAHFSLQYNFTKIIFVCCFFFLVLLTISLI